MILDNWLAITLVILASILLFTLIFWLCRKIPKFPASSDENKHTIAMILSFCFSTVSGIIFGTTVWSKYISFVTEIGAMDYTECSVIGSTTYTAADGQEIEIDPASEDYYILNITGQDLVWEDVQYGAPMFVSGEEEKDSLFSHTYCVRNSLPGVFPWEEPPSHIRATFAVGRREWLRHTYSKLPGEEINLYY